MFISFSASANLNKQILSLEEGKAVRVTPPKIKVREQVYIMFETRKVDIVEMSRDATLFFLDNLESKHNVVYKNGPRLVFFSLIEVYFNESNCFCLKLFQEEAKIRQWQSEIEKEETLQINIRSEASHFNQCFPSTSSYFELGKRFR